MVIKMLMVLKTLGCFSWDISVCKHSLYVKELKINSVMTANKTNT